MTKKIIHQRTIRASVACALFSFIVVIPAASARQERQIKTKYGIGFRSGRGFLQYQQSCILFDVYFISGEFFSGLKKSTEFGHIEFKKHGNIYRDFPDPLIIEVATRVFGCMSAPERSIPPDYGAGLMEQVSFSLVASNGPSNTKPVPLIAVEKQHLSYGEWDYFLKAEVKDVPLTDEFSIGVSLREGVARVQLRASL